MQGTLSRVLYDPTVGRVVAVLVGVVIIAIVVTRSCWDSTRGPPRSPSSRSTTWWTRAMPRSTTIRCS